VTPFRAHRAPLLGALAVTALAAACAGRAANEAPRSTVADPAAAAATITAGDMIERIGTLAHDSMRGRDTPSPGLEMAAGYLAAEFRALGLEPGGDDGSFLQRYPLPLRALDTTAVHFGSVAGGENRMLVHGVDFFAAAARPFPDAAMGHGRLVWTGRVGAGELAVGPEVQGQVMAVGVSGGFSRDFRLAVASARRAAQEAGARALLVMLDPDFATDAFTRLTRVSSNPSRALVDPAEIPIFYLTYDAASSLFGRGGLRPEQLPPAPPSPVVVAGVDTHFAAPARTIEDANPPNVVAILRGGDPALRDTYVVFSAHMDHIGVGTADATGDSIHNGADDDASGTSALVEVAEAFAALPEPPRRSLVFLAVSGEEKGLLGSRWFTDHPTVPLERTIANINVDMIGRNAPDSIVAIGQEYSSLGPLLERVAGEHPELGLTVSRDLWPQERFFFRSDHFNFARHEIPALFFFAGVHEDYHRPSDEVEKIDGDKAARVARLIFFTARAIADSPDPPRWTEQGLAEVRALTR